MYDIANSIISNFDFFFVWVWQKKNWDIQWRFQRRLYGKYDTLDRRSTTLHNNGIPLWCIHLVIGLFDHIELTVEILEYSVISSKSYVELIIIRLTNSNRYQIWKHWLSNYNNFNLRTETWLRSGMVEDGIWMFFLTIKLLPYQIHSEHITNYNKMIVVLSLHEHICGHKIEIGYFFIWLVNFHKIKNSILWSLFWPFLL